MTSHEEHTNDTESHDAADCPGPEACACARGLRRVLDGLNDGSLVIRRVQ